jgi:purine-binding chemotaxis protein CheW
MAVDEQKYVVFRLGEERYGLPIDKVERIVPSEPATKMPRAPKALLGVFELRGDTIPVMDARIRFDYPSDGAGRNFVIAYTPQGRCALKVDDVVGIISLHESEIDDSPAISGAENEDFVAGVGKLGDQLTLLLNPEGIVPKELRSKISKVAA